MVKVLLVVLVLGVTIFWVLTVLQRMGRGGPGDGGGGGGGRPPRRPLAPDDDPRFLRELDDKLWQERRRRDDPNGSDERSGSA